jgi:4-hydroxybenzoate polyprenyltransferase
MPVLTGLLRTMRPKQWTKNLLFVFPAIVFDGQLFDTDPFLRVMAAFVMLCLISGTVYIMNDIVDIESDRAHPRKKNRPLPSGQLSVGVAKVAVFIIPAGTLAAAFAFSQPLAAILIAYLLMQIVYSFKLKHVVIIDVLIIMIGFIMRVAAGVVVIDVENFSPWLYATTGLLALFLAIGKRRQELLIQGENAGNVRSNLKEYNLPLLDDMLRVVTTSTLITYILYTIEVPTDDVTAALGPNLGLITVPFVMYGLFRYLYLIHVKGEGSAPDEVLFKDRPLQITLVLFGLTFIGILYVLPEYL